MFFIWNFDASSIESSSLFRYTKLQNEKKLEDVKYET